MKLVTVRTCLLSGLLAAVVAPSSATAGPVATSDGAYQGMGRVFPDPQGGCPGSPCSPLAQGSMPATTFLGYQEFVSGLKFMNANATWQRYMEVWTLDGDLDGNTKDDGTNDTTAGTDEKANFPGNNLGFWEFTPDGAAHSAGLPAFTSAPQSDSGRVRSDVIVVRVTDEHVPDAAKQRYALSLSIHGIERAGVEGGARALEDLVTAATTDRLDTPVLTTKGLGLKTPTFREVLAKTIVYFTFPNPDGWRRGDVNDSEKGPGVMFQRYNGNGVDLNRDFPDIGFSFRPYSGLSEPESRGWAHAFRQIKSGHGPFSAGDDLHGMNGADSFSYTLLPHGSHDFAKNERIRMAAQAINLVQQDALSWSPLIQPNDAPQPECASGPLGDDCPQMYGQSWGSVYDTINYTTTGALGDWMDSSIGLNADGIDNEMAYSHITKNIAFDPLIEQMHVDGNKGLIYAHLAQMHTPSRFVFPARGRKGFVASTRVTRTEKAAPGIPPGTRAQDDIDHTIVPTSGSDTFEFTVLQGGEIHNGGMRVDVTSTNLQAIDPTAAAGKTLTVECQGCDRHRGGEHADEDGSKWVVVAQDFNQSGLYLQAGLTVAVNNPQPTDGEKTKWRARVEGAPPGTLKFHVDFTQGPATTDGATGGDEPPRLAAYDVASTDFWRQLDRFAVSGAGFTAVDAGRLAREDGAQVPTTLDSLILSDQALPGYAYPAQTAGDAPAPLEFASSRPTAPCAYGDGQPHIPTCYETFDFEIAKSGLGRAKVTMVPTSGDLTLTLYKLGADGGEEQLAPTADDSGDGGAETIAIAFPEVGKYRAYVDNWVAPSDSSWKATVAFEAVDLGPSGGDSAYTQAEYDRYAAKLKAFAEGGGNLVLTDGALRILPALFGAFKPSDVSRNISYVGQVAFTTKPTSSQQADAEGNTLADPLAKNVARAGARFNSGLRRQTYEPTPIGFSIQDASGGDASNAPQWIVNRAAFEAAGGRIVATATSGESTLTSFVTVGEIPLGKGVVRIAGALLPTPSTAFDHQEGLEPFAVTYTGYTLAENLTDWCRPGTSCVDPKLASAGGAGSGAKACIASRGFRSARVRARGKGLRFSFRRRGTAPVRVDLFQISEGRRVLRERRIARFTSRKAITWNGNKRGRRAPTDGYYFARFRVKSPSGFAEYKRIALRRQNGRWSKQRRFFGTESCGLLRQAKLSRAVFGGSNRTKLGVSWIVSRRAPVRVTVTKVGARKPVAVFKVKRSKAGKVVRRTVRKTSLKRGLYRVRIVAGKGKSARRDVMWSRKL